jgi:hypothetical protein
MIAQGRDAMNEIFESIYSAWKATPTPVAAGVALVGGWLASLVIRFLVMNLLRVVRFDRLSSRTGLTEFLRKGNVHYEPSKLAGVIAFWITMLFVFLQVARILDEGIYTALLSKMTNGIPNIAAGLLVAIVGYLLVSFIANFILTIALNASLHGARLLSRCIKWLGVIIVVTLALEQIGLGRSIVEFVFQILLAAFAFGAALAFGIGCKDIARDAAMKIIRNLREHDRASRGSDLEG